MGGGVIFENSDDEAMSEPSPGKGHVLLTTRGYATPDAKPETLKKPVTVVAGSGTPVPAPDDESFRS